MGTFRIAAGGAAKGTAPLVRPAVAVWQASEGTDCDEPRGGTGAPRMVCWGEELLLKTSKTMLK